MITIATLHCKPNHGINQLALKLMQLKPAKETKRAFLWAIISY
jgi:hypothetical protein